MTFTVTSNSADWSGETAGIVPASGIEERVRDNPGANGPPAVNNQFSGSADMVVQGGVIHGDVHLYPPQPPEPRQLPKEPIPFTGRRLELTALSTVTREALAAGTCATMSVHGVGGVGKTALVVHWAHRNIERFPDGQLYLDLRGFDPTGEALPVSSAARSLLDGLGVRPERVPVDLADQLALYRTLVFGKRIAIILDNAQHADQVIPLLPGSPTSTVLVTSRAALGELLLHGAVPLHLDVLTPVDAKELMGRYAGIGRAAAEPIELLQLLRYCDGLPLAVCIVGAQLAMRPRLSLAALAEELLDDSTRLRRLSLGGTRSSVERVFSWSYEQLPLPARRLYRVLGEVSGPDTGVAAAASLAGGSLPQARELLGTLLEANLLQEPRLSRYRMHDLIRLDARTRSEQDEPQEEREAALTRWLDHYLHTAHRADRLLKPSRWPIPLQPVAPGVVLVDLSDEPQALGWFDIEHENLTAAARTAFEKHQHLTAWQLAWTLNSYQHRRGYIYDNVAIWQMALEAAGELAQPVLQTTAHRRLGYAYLRVGNHEAAEHHLHRGLASAEASGEVPGLAHTHHAMVWILADQGEQQRALDHAEVALGYYRQSPNPVWEADLLNAVGSVFAALGRHREAKERCKRSLNLFRELGHREGEATALDQMGTIESQAGDYAAATAHFRQAADLLREFGSAYMEALVLTRLGEACHSVGRHDEARAAWQRALALFRAQHNTPRVDDLTIRLQALG